MPRKLTSSQRRVIAAMRRGASVTDVDAEPGLVSVLDPRGRFSFSRETINWLIHYGLIQHHWSHPESEDNEDSNWTLT